MAVRLVISPTANRDLLDILDYIARDNPARAVTFVADIERRARDLLTQFPRSGRVFKHKLRFIVIARYVFESANDR